MQKLRTFKVNAVVVLRGETVVVARSRAEAFAKARAAVRAAVLDSSPVRTSPYDPSTRVEFQGELAVPRRGVRP